MWSQNPVFHKSPDNNSSPAIFPLLQLCRTFSFCHMRYNVRRESSLRTRLSLIKAKWRTWQTDQKIRTRSDPHFSRTVPWHKRRMSPPPVLCSSHGCLLIFQVNQPRRRWFAQNSYTNIWNLPSLVHRRIKKCATLSHFRSALNSTVWHYSSVHRLDSLL